MGDDGNSEDFRLIRSLGKGRRSIVFAACQSSSLCEVCIKLEPEMDCEQIINEFQVLSKLKGSKGIPQVLFYGVATFQGRKYRALVTGNFFVFTSYKKKRQSWNSFYRHHHCRLCWFKKICRGSI